MLVAGRMKWNGRVKVSFHQEKKTLADREGKLKRKHEDDGQVQAKGAFLILHILTGLHGDSHPHCLKALSSSPAKVRTGSPRRSCVVEMRTGQARPFSRSRAHGDVTGTCNRSRRHREQFVLFFCVSSLHTQGPGPRCIGTSQETEVRCSDWPKTGGVGTLMIGQTARLAVCLGW